MKVINKIGILVSWPREIDMFSTFTEDILEDVVFIVDDFKYHTQEEKYENAKNIVELLDNKKDYVFLSKVLRKSKYKILISTSQTLNEKITYKSYLKYIYSKYVGSFLLFSGLSEFFLKIIGRSLVADGKNATKFGRYQVEKELGVKVIKFPKGLDVSKLTYPDKQWEDIFDIYFCHSKVDQDLITTKFSNVKCINIGYPRYDNMPSVESAKKIIFNEINNIDVSKPTLLWIPTIIRYKDGLIDNIRVWIPSIRGLLSKYNVIIRPHPKIVVIDPNIVNELADIGFLLDIKKNRNLGVLYKSVDLVLADYGGSVLSAIYMKNKLILLNIMSEYTRMREKRMYVDSDVRGSVNSFNVDDGVLLAKQIDNDIQDNSKSTRNRLKKQYFGSGKDCKDIKEISNELAKELHI
jgi:hypothetical protein